LEGDREGPPPPPFDIEVRGVDVPLEGTANRGLELVDAESLEDPDMECTASMDLLPIVGAGALASSLGMSKLNVEREPFDDEGVASLDSGLAELFEVLVGEFEFEWAALDGCKKLEAASPRRDLEDGEDELADA